eukprot:3098254-Pyramimonas_sp.AAC.1
MRRGRAPSHSPDRMRARFSGACSSGVQRPHPPDAGATRGPLWQTAKPRAPPRRDRLRGNPPRDDQRRGGEYPE